jgi:hypothetical protein
LIEEEMEMEGKVGKDEVCHDELRWQVVKALIDEFPSLKNRIKEYIE